MTKPRQTSRRMKSGTNRWLVLALVMVAAAACSDGGGRGGEAAQDACAVVDRQVAERDERPLDLVGLDRAAIDAELQGQESRLRDLVAANAIHAPLFTAAADLLARARPEVVARWGDDDGTELEARAHASRRFFVVPQALLEAGLQDADRWSQVNADASWATFALAAGCHGVPAIPGDVPNSRPVEARPPVPVLALDRAAGNQLVRVGGDGAHDPVGAVGSGLAFPALSPDGRTLISGLGEVRTLSIEGVALSDFDGFWDCGGWLGDGTSVLGRYVDDDTMAFEPADQPGHVLAITGGFCPEPAISPDEVVIDQGRGSEDNWVAVQRIADGSTAREFRVEGCNLTSGTASPATSTLAFAASCDDLLDSGIWVGDATGKLAHVLTCVCGVPAFSPDGRWLAYVISPVEGTGGFDTHLGFARTDGTEAFHLPSGRLSFPLWPDLR